jgi:hypothetical protein
VSTESTVPSTSAVPAEHVSASTLRDGRPIRRPDDVGAYQFAVVSALRAGQLLRGCIPRVNAGAHRATVVAQLEVADGKIMELSKASDAK